MTVKGFLRRSKVRHTVDYQKATLGPIYSPRGQVPNRGTDVAALV